MNSLWKIVRPLMAVIGAILMVGAVGRSDFYVLELGQSEPASVWTTLFIGLLMMLPTAIHLIYETIKENRS